MKDRNCNSPWHRLAMAAVLALAGGLAAAQEAADIRGDLAGCAQVVGSDEMNDRGTRLISYMVRNNCPDTIEPLRYSETGYSMGYELIAPGDTKRLINITPGVTHLKIVCPGTDAEKARTTNRQPGPDTCQGSRQFLAQKAKGGAGQKAAGGKPDQSGDKTASAQNASAEKGKDAKDKDKEKDNKQKFRYVSPVMECIEVGHEGYGQFRNKCGFKVWNSFCVENPEKGSWGEAHDCRKGVRQGDYIGPNGVSAAHTKGGTQVHYFTCKSPSSIEKPRFVQGRIHAQCKLWDYNEKEYNGQ